MSHEEPRVARRSASQGTLNGSYAIPARASSAISDSGHHLVPYFKPLRSIREHGHTFLDPAASADGMLRKTTETGNIGLFSINTGRPAALRPRASLGDLRQPHRPFSRSSDRPHGHDVRRRLPSYRDSTSEIISMYGSDNQSSSKSLSGTLSPPWDDSGQRSYSMTTCASKSYSLPRNHGSHLAHDVQAGVQRPRSPYPYPTRLPRPGIRPSSPALTENGIVDYSRMVEIDRIPQRTIHHPHKTLFPYKTTRDQPGPLSLRFGINQSERSLPHDRSLARPSPTAMTRRPPLPNHLHPWGLRPRDRLGSGSSERSLRTVSLSSTGSAPQQIPRLQVPDKKAPIFYDYSEDFEDAINPPLDFPIANPTPKRISKSFRPGIPDDGCEAASESAKEGVDHVADYLRRVTMNESDEDHGGLDEDYELHHYRPVSQLYQRGSPAQPCSYQPVEKLPSSRCVHTVASSDASIVTLDYHQLTMGELQTGGADHAIEPRNNGLVSEASTGESPLDPETPNVDVEIPLAEAACLYDEELVYPDHHEKFDDNNGDDSLNGILESHMKLMDPAIATVPGPAIATMASTTHPHRYSSGRQDSRLFSLSSGLSDLASFVKYVDKHMEALDFDNTDQHHIPVPGSRSEPGNSGPGLHCNQTVQKTHAPPRTSSLAHQKMNQLRIKLGTPAPIDDLEQYQVISTRSGPTLVPQPISPAKILRLKNSIPHLMKALPPLPGYSPASESPFNPTIVPIEFEPFEFSRLTDARSTLIEPFGSESHSEPVSEDYNPFVFDREIRKPKLKLKNAKSQAPGNIGRLRPGNLAQADRTMPEASEKRSSLVGVNDSSAPVKRRLPIKVSRPALASMASEDSGTVKRRPGFDKSSTVSELSSSQPVNLFSTWTDIEMAVQKAHFPPAQHSPSSNKSHEPVSVIESPAGARSQQVAVIDEGRGVSLDTHLNALHSPKTKTEVAGEDEMQSFFSDSLVRPRQGLRKKLSYFKSRLTESRHHQYPSTVNTVAHRASGNKNTQTDTEVHEPKEYTYPLTGRSPTSPTKDYHTVTPKRTVRSKWEKLVNGAKHRLRTWGKNRHKCE